MSVNGFCDLNICLPSNQFRSDYIDQLISLGYKTIALNTIIEQESNETAKKKKGQSKEAIPAPQIFKDTNGKLQIMQRVTVHFTDSNQLQKLCRSENVKKYDIVSVIPTCFNAFQLACACKDIDIISFDASERPINMNRKSYNLAIANCLYFEVPYAPAIADSGMRKNTIQIAHAYHAFGKSKNIVITSGATDITKIRGPYDVVNLGLLFGLSEEQAKHSLLNTSRALILRAEGRRFGKTAMTLMIKSLDIDSGEDSDEEEEPMAKRSKTAGSHFVTN